MAEAGDWLKVEWHSPADARGSDDGVSCPHKFFFVEKSATSTTSLLRLKSVLLTPIPLSVGVGWCLMREGRAAFLVVDEAGGVAGGESAEGERGTPT